MRRFIIKSRRSVVFLAMAVMAIGLVHTASANNDIPKPLEPKMVVENLMHAMQTNDADAIRASFDANASQAYGNGAERSGEAFFRWLDSDIISREGRVDNAQLAVTGNQVVVTGQYNSRGYTSKADFLMVVENGLVMSWRMRY